MSTLADVMLAWKVKLTTKMTSEQVLTLRSDVNDFADDVRFLEDENAKLRELVKDVWHELKNETDKLKDDNDNLRELVRYMWYADYAGHFSTLPNHQKHQETVWQRMHELGIVE